MKKPAVPAIQTGDPAIFGVLSALKENVELLTGVRTTPLDTLPSDADLSQVILKVNEIIDRLNTP